MIAEDRSRLLDLQRARLQQVQGQLLALDRAILASVAEEMDERPAIPEGVYDNAATQRRETWWARKDGTTYLAQSIAADAIDRRGSPYRQPFGALPDLPAAPSPKPATRRERTQPFAYAGDGRAQRHEREPAFPTRPAAKPSAEDIERANAYLRRLGVPEGLL